ncbi:MAG: membrane protein insertion efficiency factor YidD [Clostridia bacterium]|nr:membrane protein insertion efficiency factor YidD [Clostridia bacterium]
MKHLCIWLIRFYRRCLSPLKRKPCCRFVPTCSAYALEAFQKRGFFVGMILSVSRILRCNPYCAGGYDPVPDKGFRYKGSREIPMPSPGCEEHSTCQCKDTQTPPSVPKGKENKE